LAAPKKKKEMAWSKLGDTYVLVDPETKKTYNIDATSFLIWIQCDGKTTVDDMTDIFSVDGNKDIVKAAILGIIDKLKDYGLVEYSP
jgi:hypothetical protein